METPSFHILSFSLLLLFAACTSKERSDDSLVPVRLEMRPEAVVPDTVLMEKQKIVFLETTEDAMVRFMTGVAYCDSLIFVFDSQQGTVFVFDAQGRFLHKVHRMGSGPTEYTGLHSMTIDPVHRELIVATNPPTRIQFYSFEGEFLDEFPIKDEANEILYADNSILASVVVNKEYVLARYELDGHRLKQALPIDVPMVEVRNYVSPMGSTLVKNGDKVFYTKRFDNTIYRITGNDAEPYRKFNFGKYNFSDENLLDQMAMIERMGKKQCITLLSGVRVTDKKLFFFAYPHGLFYGNDGQLANYRCIENTRLALRASQSLNFQSSEANMLAFAGDAASLKVLLKCKHIKEEALAEKIARLPDDSNPVLYFYWLR